MFINSGIISFLTQKEKNSVLVIFLQQCAKTYVIRSLFSFSNFYKFLWRKKSTISTTSHLHNVCKTPIFSAEKKNKCFKI